VAFAITVFACSLIFLYWDVQHITHSALEWFGKILGMSWKAPQTIVESDDRWDFLWSDEPSNAIGSYTTE
jgi:hypothetical protein